MHCIVVSMLYDQIRHPGFSSKQCSTEFGSIHVALGFSIELQNDNFVLFEKKKKKKKNSRSNLYSFRIKFHFIW